MKKYLLLISLLFVTINVNASNGICDGRPIVSNGYCELENPIKHSSDSIEGYKFTKDGGTTTKWHHKATIEEKEIDLYCIDPNRTTPDTLYYGKELSVENGAYDAGLIKMHQVYLATKGNYIDVNTAVRFFNAGLGYGKGGGGEDIEKYINGANTFEGLEPQYPDFPTISTDQNYAASQAIFCAGKVAGGSSAFCKSFLSGYDSIYTDETKDYNIEFVVDGTPEDVEGTSYDYHKRVKVKVEGIDDINDAIQNYGLQDLGSEITFEKVSCSKGNCKANISEGTDLLNGDSTFELEVYGSYEDIASNSKITVEIEYKYYFPFGASGVGILVDSPSEGKQRMIGYLDSMHHKLSFDLDITLPNVCKFEDGQYKLGNKAVGIDEYINAGCCEGVEEGKLSKEQKDIYNEQCKDQDVVNLVTDCQGDCNEDGSVNKEPSDSSVEQIDYDTLLKKIKTSEKKVVDGKTTTTDYSNYTKNALKYWRDDEFEKELENNEYCKIYTTEENHMIYPMTTASTSGRFFVFTKDDKGEYSQPEVTGEITAFFNTAYDVWRKDYKTAILAEMEAFTKYQSALNKEDAIKVANEEGDKTETKCCDYDEENETCNVEPEEYTYRSGTAKGKYYDGTYNNTTPQKAETAYWVTKGNSCVKTSTDSSGLKQARKDYADAIKTRKTLEDKKRTCEKINKKFDNSWKYILDPDLSFTYTQQYYDSVSGNTKVVEQEVEFIKAEGTNDDNGLAKYWPKTSQLPAKQSSTNNNTSVNFTENAKTSKYGGAKYGYPVAAKTGELEPDNEMKGANNPFMEVDEPSENQPNSSQTWKADLYYRPTVGYYSLVPSGLYVTDQQMNSYPDAINIGYVFNVQITNYQGKYRTWFTIENNGHLEIEPKGKSKNLSNVQYRINQKLADDSSVFESLCVYCNREVIYDRDCSTCVPPVTPDSDKFYPNYVYRTINPSNMDPNNRKDSGDLGNNWSDAKGEAAESRIRQIGLKDGMFDDSADSETLEYVFNLDTKTMQEIKKYNKNSNYYDWSNGYSGSLFSCNEDGKECISSFVTRYASNISGRQKYKYYIDGSFKEGTIKQLLPGGYPDVELDDEGKIYP